MILYSTDDEVFDCICVEDAIDDFISWHDLKDGDAFEVFEADCSDNYKKVNTIKVLYVNGEGCIINEPK